MTYTVQATIASSASGTLSNTATVTPPDGVTEIDPANASATDTDTLTPQAELEITKTDNLGGSSVSNAIGTAVPGQGITYTIVVTNAGPSDVTGAAVDRHVAEHAQRRNVHGRGNRRRQWLHGQRQRQHRRQQRRLAGRQHDDVHACTANDRLVRHRHSVEHGNGDAAGRGDR